MASRYAHAKQFKRMKKMNNKLKSRLGRVKRDIERQLTNYSVDIQSLFEVALEQAQKLIEQELVLKVVRAILMMDTLYCHNWNSALLTGAIVDMR